MTNETQKPQVKRLPLHFGGRDKTEILKMKVDEMLQRLPDRVKNFYPDGVFPGQEDGGPPDVRVAKYLQNTTMADMALLRNPDYADLYKQGLAPAPESPFWINALSMPDVFKRLQRDFMRLLGMYTPPAPRHNPEGGAHTGENVSEVSPQLPHETSNPGVVQPGQVPNAPASY